MLLIWFFLFIVLSVTCAADHGIEVNYDIGNFKLLNVNQTLEIICKNKRNSNPPSWTYPRRLYNSPRMKFHFDIAESRLVIDKAEAEDAGKYGCEIDHEYQGRIVQDKKEIDVIVIEIAKVETVETEDGIKLFCIVQAYPTPYVFWKIEFDKEELNPTTEAPGPDDDNWTPTDSEPMRVVVEKSNGRFTLRQYNGVNNAELIIANVTPDDNGKYFCVARNLLGEKCKDCTVRVRREPKGSTSIKNENTAFNQDEINPQGEQKEGLRAEAIAASIILSVIFVLGCVLAACLWMRKKKIRNETVHEDAEMPLNESPMPGGNKKEGDG